MCARVVCVRVMCVRMGEGERNILIGRSCEYPPLKSSQKLFEF